MCSGGFSSFAFLALSIEWSMFCNRLRNAGCGTRILPQIGEKCLRYQHFEIVFAIWEISQCFCRRMHVPHSALLRPLRNVYHSIDDARKEKDVLLPVFIFCLPCIVNWVVNGLQQTQKYRMRSAEEFMYRILHFCVCCKMFTALNWRCKEEKDVLRRVFIFCLPGIVNWAVNVLQPTQKYRMWYMNLSADWRKISTLQHFEIVFAIWETSQCFRRRIHVPILHFYVRCEMFTTQLTMQGRKKMSSVGFSSFAFLASSTEQSMFCNRLRSTGCSPQKNSCTTSCTSASAAKCLPLNWRCKEGKRCAPSGFIFCLPCIVNWVVNVLQRTQKCRMRYMNSSADWGKISSLPDFRNCFRDMRNVSMFSVIRWKNSFQNQFVYKICSTSRSVQFTETN